MQEGPRKSGQGMDLNFTGKGYRCHVRVTYQDVSPGKGVPGLESRSAHGTGGSSESWDRRHE